MSPMASQITAVLIVCSTVCSKNKIKENIKAPRHGPSQRSSNAENVSIWWRHHMCTYCMGHSLPYCVLLMFPLHERHGVANRRNKAIICLTAFRTKRKRTSNSKSLARVTHIFVGNLAVIGSDNGLSPGRRQAIIWTNAGILLIGPLETNFSEI